MRIKVPLHCAALVKQSLINRKQNVHQLHYNYIVSSTSFEQRYNITTKNIISDKMHPKPNPRPTSNSFKGVQVYFDPEYVTDILCSGSTGHLSSILTQPLSSKPKFQCHFVTKNSDFIVGIEYPDVEGDNAGDNQDDIRIVYEDKKDNLLFSRMITNERLQTMDGIRQDSLVTKSLLDMTSYQENNMNTEDQVPFYQEDPEDSSENRMSFDDLGKIYKNISRSQILSNVSIASSGL
jgi:hypothetical protein